MIKVTVILVTYNSEKYLQRTIDSVLNQKGRGEHFDIELIVVDDCSKDDTTGILRSNKLSYYVTEGNSGGPNRGRNIGLKAAAGDYICFIDHDDEWEPEKILLQLKAAHYAPVITTGYCIVDDKGPDVYRVLHAHEPVLFRENETFISLLRKENKRQNTCLSTLMIKSDLKNILFEEYFGMSDYDWLLKLFENRSSVEIPQSLVNRYVTGGNLSLNQEYRRKDYYAVLLTLETYENNYPRDVRTGMKRTHGSRARYFYLINQMKNARTYFMMGPMNLKTIAFLLTSYFGSSLVRKYFRFFG